MEYGKVKTINQLFNLLYAISKFAQAQQGAFAGAICAAGCKIGQAIMHVRGKRRSREVWLEAGCWVCAAPIIAKIARARLGPSKLNNMQCTTLLFC